MASKDQMRYRKTYSYYRVQPRTQELEIIADESLDWKHSVRAASTGDLSLTGATPLSIDGVTLAASERVLLKDQGTGSQNGIYYVEISGGTYTLTRDTDAVQGTLTCGATTYVEEGTTQSGTIWILSTYNPLTIGSTSLTWTQFSGGGGGGGGGTSYWFSAGADAIYTTGSVGIGGAVGAFGTDVYFYTSGSVSGIGLDDKKAVFGGDVRVSGSLTFGSGNQFFTLKSLMPAGSTGRNIFIGNGAEGNSLTWTSGFLEGSYNVVMGSSAGLNLTTGHTNVLVGTSAGVAMTSGQGNVALGDSSLAAATTSFGNTAIGRGSSQSLTGIRNVSVGSNALNCIVTNTGNFNVAVGDSALRDGPGAGNVGLGASALESLSNASAKDNVSVGYNAGKYYGIGNPLTNTSGSIFIGAGAAAEGDSQYNQIVIGSGSRGLGSNTTVIGNGLTTLTSIPSGSVGIGTWSVSNIGSDVFFFVSGSITGSGVNDKKSVFGGDVVMSGSLEVSGDQVEITGSLRVTNGISGSLTRLTDGTAYILAGPNITINTGSNGSVQISGSAGGGITGSGTDGYLTRWTGTSTLGNSHILYWTSGAGGSIYRYRGYQHQFNDPSDSVRLVLEADNTTGARVGINSSGPAYPLDVSEGVAGTSTIASFRNTDASGGTDRGIQMYMGAGNFNPGTFQLLHEWKTDRHYTRFKTTNLSSLAPPTSGPIEDLLVLSSDRKVLVTGSLSVRYDGSSQVGTVVDVQKLDGNQIMWISSSAGTNPVGTDVFMWVSGSRTDNNSGADKVVFGGDVRVSGSLTIGTGSVFITSNNIQFGSTSMRVEKNGNDMKFFDISNPSGLTLSELAAGGGGGGSSPEYWSSPSSGFIYSTGSVGIGSTVNDSSYKFNVYQTTNFDDLRVKFEQAGADYGSKIHLVGGNSAAPAGASTNEISSLYRDGIGDLQFMWRVWGGLETSNMAFDTGGVEAMRINASQNVGIGTSTMTARVNVFGSNGNIGMIVQGGTTAPAINKPILQVKGYDGGVVLHVSGSSTHGARVGIGTTNPREICRLDVGSKASTATDNYVAVNAATTGECGFSWSDGGTQLWKFQRAASTSNISLVESGASNIALLCEYSTGNVGINTNNPSEKLHIDTGNIKVDTSGYGVRLASSPSNADAQTLDAYYEADLSAVIDCSGNEGNGVYVLDVAYDTLKMTRVGRLVTIGGDLRIDSLGDTPSGRLYILLGTTSGQYPSMDTAASVYVTGAIDLSGAIASSIQAYVEASTDKMYIDGYLDGSKVDIATQVGAGVTIKISVTYAV